MDETLKTILVKLVRDRGASLTEADLAYAAKAVGQPAPEVREGPAPLWRFIRRKTLLFRGIIDYNLDAEVDPILIDAGASAEHFKGYQADIRKMALVTRDGLKRAVRRHLTHEQTSVRAHAARLVGLLELDDTAALLVDSIESGREERADWGHPVIAASLEALAFLGHPQARALAMKYVSHDDWSLRRAAQTTALVAEGIPTNAELRRIFDTQFEPQILPWVPDVFIGAAKNGGLTAEDVEGFLENLPLHINACEAVASIVIGAAWKDCFKKFLADEDADLRTALAAQIAWSDATWALPMLREQLEEEQAPSVRMALVTAIGTISDRDETLIAARLASDDQSDKLGAIWATLGTGRYQEELNTLLRDSDPQVRRAAGAALAANTKTPDAQHLETRFTDLLNNEDAWWPWGLPLKCLAGAGIALPVSAQAFRYVSSDGGRFNSRDLDRALELFKEHPLQLLRWLRADVPGSQRTRAIAFAAMIGGPTFESALADTLLAAERSDVAAAAALEVLASPGHRSQAVELKVRVSLIEQPKAGEGGLLPAAVFASSGDAQLRKRATACLGAFGDEAEPYLTMLLASAEAEVARAAADVVAQLASPRDPMLADVARLLTGDARKLSDLPSLERLVVSLSPRVRGALAELGAMPETSKEDVLRVFPFLIADRDEDVAAAALGALAAQAGDVMWVKELVLAQTWSPQWRTKEKAISAMAQIADAMYVPRLLEISGEDDGSAKDNAVRGLERASELRPELGLVVLDIRDPSRIVSRFGLSERVNYDADKHTEALRMLLLGLDKRKDAAEAKKHVGRKVMLTLATDESAAHGNTTWTTPQFDALAMHLKVVYTDDESGAIVAEVTEEVSGEVLSALLQSTSLAVRRVAWS